MAEDDNDGSKFDELNFINISEDFKNLVTVRGYLDASDSDGWSDDCESDASSQSSVLNTTQSYEALWSTYSPIGECELLRKKVIKKGNGVSTKRDPFVKVQLSGFWEGETKPFEYDKSVVWDLQNDFLMPGILIAVESMEVGEYSMFLISHEIMYGEMGCPPRIRPKSTCLYHIRILGSMKENARASKKELSFEEILGKVNDMCTQGESFYKKGLFSQAKGSLNSALHMLNGCPLANEAESRKSTSKLLCVHLYIAMCYIKMNQPKRACSVCNDMKKIDINAFMKNYRALFQNGLALMMIGEINEAERKFLAAIKLNPNNKDIKAQLNLIAELNKKKREKADYIKAMSEANILSK